jgi:carbohydrate-selective porin OprB
MAIEASYQANFGKGFSLQPNAQLILNPYNANTATSQRRAIVIGLRTAFRL